MPVERYVIVDDDVSNKVIISGPCQWDGNLETWQPPEGTMAILETVALADGYTWPPPEGSGE